MGRYSWTSSGRLTTVDESHHGTSHDIHDDGHPRVALVIGVTGIVGVSLAQILPRSDTPGGPWKVYGVARRPQPQWFADAPVEYIQCDVLDEADTRAKIGPLCDVTHLFWVVWVSRETEERNCQDNGKMFQNVLDVLVLNAPGLQHVILQTGSKHYMGSFDAIGKVEPHEPPYKEDMPRLPVPNFYYTLEDVLFETVKKKNGLTWSVHRPNAIIGFSPWSLMNLLVSLATYAVICKQDGLPFIYPGNRETWEHYGDVADSELIAEQEIWACIEPTAKNQAFNVANGDVFNFKRLWRLLAEKFGLEVLPYDGKPRSLEAMMKDKEHVWDDIVKKHGLVSTKLEEVGSWWFADFYLNLPAYGVVSMNKSKQHGFYGFRDTEASMMEWVDKMRARKLIP